MNNPLTSNELKSKIKSLLSSYAAMIQMIDEQPNNKVMIDLLNYYTAELKKVTSDYIHVKQVNSKIGL